MQTAQQLPGGAWGYTRKRQKVATREAEMKDMFFPQWVRGDHHRLITSHIQTQGRCALILAQALEL